ncbi:hypothetical protein SESBI_36610 [Sesbania bispinosa]|nr:hypothetical protein SESBI_36610 [Sesbania bispinosa]
MERQLSLLILLIIKCQAINPLILLDLLRRGKNKGCVGLHPKSRVRFKGGKEVACKFANAAQATWPFVSAVEASLVRPDLLQTETLNAPSDVREPTFLGPKHSSSKPPDDLNQAHSVGDPPGSMANEVALFDDSVRVNGLNTKDSQMDSLGTMVSSTTNYS